MCPSPTFTIDFSVYKNIDDLHSKLRSEVIDQLHLASAGQPSGSSSHPRPGDRREPDGGEDPLRDNRRPARSQPHRDLLALLRFINVFMRKD